MSDVQAPLVLRHLAGFYATLVLAVAERTGLLDALATSSGTTAELAQRCGLDERNTTEALRGLVAARVAEYREGTYSLTDEGRLVLDPDFPVGIRAVLRVNGHFSPLVGAVSDAARTGAGIDGDAFGALIGSGLQHMGGINLPMYRQALCADWLAGTPVIADHLGRGADILDVACGAGHTVRLVAEAFPDSTVQGWDPVAADAVDLPGNATLHAGLLADVPTASFDVAYCLDSFHHMGDAALQAGHLHRVLRPGGAVLIAEDATSGDVATDTANELSVIAYGSRLLYCMQESLAAGGEGLTSSDGTGWVVESLSGAGFTAVSERDTPYGMRLITAVKLA